MCKCSTEISAFEGAQTFGLIVLVTSLILYYWTTIADIIQGELEVKSKKELLIYLFPFCIWIVALIGYIRSLD